MKLIQANICRYEFNCHPIFFKLSDWVNVTICPGVRLNTNIASFNPEYSRSKNLIVIFRQTCIACVTTFFTNATKSPVSKADKRISSKCKSTAVSYFPRKSCNKSVLLPLRRILLIMVAKERATSICWSNSRCKPVSFQEKPKFRLSITFDISSCFNIIFNMNIRDKDITFSDINR